MALALEAKAMKDDIMLGDTPKAKRRRRRLSGINAAGRLWKHSTLADIEGLVSREEIASMFVFTLVRNPWDRIVSYYHWLRAQSFDHPAVRLAREMAFERFLKQSQVQRSFRTSSAASYMRDGAGIERARSYLRLEHFKDDAEPLFQHLGFDFALPHANASDRMADYRGYYSDHTREIVANCFAEDINRFDYRF